MSPFSRLQRLLIVIPAAEKARSLETEDAMIGTSCPMLDNGVH